MRMSESESDMIVVAGIHDTGTPHSQGYSPLSHSSILPTVV